MWPTASLKFDFYRDFTKYVTDRNRPIQTVLDELHVEGEMERQNGQMQERRSRLFHPKAIQHHWLC